MIGRTLVRSYVSVWAVIMTLTPCCLSATAAKKSPAEKPKPAIELGVPFADNAILQRQMPAPVWGWSKPGTTVTVEFGGQKKTATAGEDGKWMLRLDTLEASAEPREMVIADGEGNKVVLKNILVGEVWMCSGQSNMQWTATKSSSSLIIKKLVEDAKAGKGKLPPIREGKVTSVFSSLHPIEHAQGEWSDGSNFMDYSAIAFAFAYELYKELNVPIGILNCAFSTTTIQAWTPREGLEGAADDYTKGLRQQALEGDVRTPEHKAAWERYYQALRDWAKDSAEKCGKGLSIERNPSCPGNLHGNRDISWMYNGKISPVVPYAIRGAIWNQGYANGNEGFVYYHNLHNLIRGWRKVWGRPDLPVYFHQFYCPGTANDGLSLNSTAEMRLGTSLARDIPNADMASQIDICGAVHYYNKAVPGQRLALHALKNQYAKNIVSDGPVFKSYKVEGEKLIVEFDFAAGGLVVGNTTMGQRIETPEVIENGEDKVTLFYIADKDRLWHRAKMKIDGEKVVLTAPGVAEPCGVAYGCNGIGTLPNLYNRAMLPMTPFIYYDHKLVTSETWPDSPIKVAGVDYGPAWKHRIVSVASQYRDDCVIQAGVPTPFWGAASEGSVIKLSFAGIEKTVTVGPGQGEWQIVIPPLPASDEPKTLKLTCERDGQLYAVTEVPDIVVGDVWYVSVGDFEFTAPLETKDKNVRMFAPRAAKRSNPMPFRYKLEIPPKGTRQYAIWRSAKDLSEKSPEDVLANILGARIRAKTGKPVGIVIMDAKNPKEGPAVQIKSWIGFEWLKQAPSLMADYKALTPSYHPDPRSFSERARKNISEWTAFWKTVPPAILAAKRFEAGAASIALPAFPPANTVTTPATQTYNMLIAAFNPANFKGAICLTPESFFADDQGANFASEFSVMANCWKESFAPRQGSGQGGEDPCFFYTIPGKTLAPKITRPEQIKGKSTACEIGHWLTAKRGDKEDMAAVNKQLMGFIDMVVGEVYK